ncbi:M23 family metallopeptidase [Streptomyces colonosanans]|uniref:Peptidase n=1 Tax=Streptomyces colonosanans TaxID=1428652 RepID=A0A1S2PAJ5_9ACTN|nr:M23 family metallopeptidase [Streptomyces colonosanans]OIJ90627.1 peptidase [Streptomyces colonosanans]
MFNRVTPRSFRTSRLRTRVAVLASGVGAAAALGVGVAHAAGAHAASSAPQAAGAATKAVSSGTKAVKPSTKPVGASTKVVNTAGWVTPVKQYALSASFAQAGGMWQHTHSGQDFAVPSGTDVVAASGGTVVKVGGNGAGDGPAYGNAVVIKHAGGTYSQYAHLSQVDVRVGQAVSAGQHIAKSGNTGNSTGPHLHFEIRTTPNYGSAVNPVDFLRAKGVTL